MKYRLHLELHLKSLSKWSLYY